MELGRRYVGALPAAPGRVAAFRRHLEGYAGRLRESGLSDGQLGLRYTPGLVIRYALSNTLNLLVTLPLALWGWALDRHLLHVALMSLGTLAVKAIIIPLLLSRAIREANVRREAEPFISLHVSVLIAAALVGFSFWLGTVLVPPRPAPTPLLVPIAFATLLVGFLVLITRRKAVTQVVGYLMLENGVFIFGQTLVEEIPFAVELGILLARLQGLLRRSQWLRSGSHASEPTVEGNGMKAANTSDVFSFRGKTIDFGTLEPHGCFVGSHAVVVLLLYVVAFAAITAYLSRTRDITA